MADTKYTRFTDLVTISEGRLTTTSLIVANHFGKRHDNVLQGIENLECSQEFREANFFLSHYTNKQNKPFRFYKITYDGFTMLPLTKNGGHPVIEHFITSFHTLRIGEEAKPAGTLDTRNSTPRRKIDDVYAILFDNGVVKVGRGRNGLKRVEQHIYDSAKYLISVVEYVIKRESRVKESALLKFCANRATKCVGKEYFIGVDFAELKGLLS